MPILTFVSLKPQPNFDAALHQLCPSVDILERIELDNRAVRWGVGEGIDKQTVDLMRDSFDGDIFYQHSKDPIKLFMADMDSTIVSGETLDDMADMIGLGEKISAITARAMRGELDFEQALCERIGLLKGMSRDVIDKTLSRMICNTGARELLSVLKRNDVTCVLVSGGFQQFTSAVARELGFDQSFGNRLVIENGFLTGDVEYPILDKSFKLAKMQELQKEMGIGANQIIAIGDGANDLPMLQAAGIGVAYKGKPLLRETFINQINRTDLSSLRYVIE